MGDNSEIQWTDATWNCVRGCSRVSAGCGAGTGGGCYAERQAHRFSYSGGPYEGLTRLTATGPRWTGEVRLVPEMLDLPLRWKRPRRIFVNSMSDLFHEKLSDEDIDRVFAVMALCDGERSNGRHHTFQVLTKRPARMRAYLNDPETPFRIAAWVADRVVGFRPRKGSVDWSRWAEWPLPHVWLGVSVEDQATADERIPHLLETPAAVRFLSVEPLLGPVNFMRVLIANKLDRPAPVFWDREAVSRHCDELPRLHWVIAGGESGPGARPCDVAWIRSVVEQCKAADVACFVKQLGAYAILDPRYDRSLPGATRKLRDRKGADMEEWPADLRGVRELPEVRG